MEWINIADGKPKPFEMVILDTDKGIAVGCINPFGQFTHTVFGFVGTVHHSHYEVIRWMPLPKKE